MLLRRHKDIIAMKRSAADAAVAFHARNLEVAELSDDAWNSMVPTQLESSEPLFKLAVAEASESLESWNNEINPNLKSGKVQFGIRSVTINITQICNLHCTYCAAGGDGTYGEVQKRISVEKTLPQLRFFIEKLSVGQSFRIIFLGGEPLLYPKAIELIGEYVSSLTTEKNIQVEYSIVTNGTLINDENLSILKKIKCNVTISLDGPKEINDVTRPQKNGKGSTDAVITGLMKVLDNKEYLGRVALHAVFSKDNMNVLKAYEFFSTFAVDSYEFTYSVDSSDEVTSKDFSDQMKEIARLAYESGGEKDLRKIDLFDRYFTTLDSQTQVENFCGAGKSYLMIDARNQIFTCPWEVGNKENQVGTGSSLNMQKLEELSMPLIERNNCQTCWARFVCGGGCMFAHKSQTGTKNGKDLNFCVRTRDLISAIIVYYKECRTSC